MKRPEFVVLATLIVVSLVVWAVWAHRWRAQNAQREEMYALYAHASGGDRASVRQLARYDSPEATQLIERLAQDQNAFSDGRLEAINVLGTKQPVAAKTLAPLLWIDQPFVIRRAAAEVFKQRGCGKECISETLMALHAIREGQPTLEVRLEDQIASHTARDQEYSTYLHKQTEEDYFALLDSNQCLTRQILQTDYSSDSAFLDLIGKKVGPC